MDEKQRTNKKHSYSTVSFIVLFIFFTYVPCVFNNHTGQYWEDKKTNENLIKMMKYLPITEGLQMATSSHSQLWYL